MRKLYLVLALAVLIQSCGGLSLGSGQPDVTATATMSPTPLDTPAFTLTPSITPSATIVHIPTLDLFPPTATVGVIPLFVGSATATQFQFSTPTPSGPGPGFISIEVTEKLIHWGVCKPNRTRIVAKVENPEAVFSVIIFVQVKDFFEDDHTPWTTGNTMQNHWNGTFTYMLTANSTEGHNHYKRSWIRFQLVATNDYGEVIARSRIYANEIQLTPCL